MILTLPLPPSANNMFLNVPRRGRIKSTKYKDWQEAAGDVATKQARTQSRINGPYSVSIRVPLKMRPDLDNVCKAPLDLLVALGLTDDDRFCQKIELSRSADVKPRFCTILVQPA